MALIRGGDSRLTTSEQVFDALGGNAGLIEATGAKPQQVSTWRTSGKFPPQRFVQIEGALKRKGLSVAPGLFRMHLGKTNGRAYRSA